MCLGYRPYEDEITLYYNIERNIMEDEGGYEIPNLFSIISPNAFYLFRKKKEDMVVYGVNGRIIELLYPVYD
jgi:hypothetical protein